MKKVFQPPKIVIIALLLVFIGLVPCNSFAEKEKQSPKNTKPAVLPSILSITSFLLNKSVSGIVVLGEDDTCYQIYNEKGDLLEECAELGQLVEVPYGNYTLNLNNSTQNVTVTPREILTVYTGRVTFSGPESLPIFYPGETEPITEVTREGLNLFPNHYEYEEAEEGGGGGARRIQMPVKPARFTRIIIIGPTIIWELVPKPSGPIFIPPPADIIVVECDGSTLPTQQHIMDCLENKTSNLNGKFKGMVRSALKAALQNIGLSIPGTSSNVTSMLSDAFALNEPRASAPTKDEWKKFLDEYTKKDTGCGLPFGHGVICVD